MLNLPATVQILNPTLNFTHFVFVHVDDKLFLHVFTIFFSALLVAKKWKLMIQMDFSTNLFSHDSSSPSFQPPAWWSPSHIFHMKSMFFFFFSKKRWLPTAVGKDTFKNNLRELVIEYVCHEALDELCFNLYVWDSRNYTMIWSNVWETQILILYIRDAWLKCQNDTLMLEMFLILNVDLKVTTVVTFPPATGRLTESNIFKTWHINSTPKVLFESYRIWVMVFH